GKVTPWATSSSRSTATRVYSRTRPGRCGSEGGGFSSASRSPGAPGAGASSPIIAAWPRRGVPSMWSWCASGSRPRANASFASGAEAITGAAPASSFLRESLATPKDYILDSLTSSPLSENAQDYLKEIYKLQSEEGRATTSALADRVGVAAPSATA